MKILIIEDEIISFSRLRRLLLEIDESFQIFGPFTCVGDIVNDLRKHNDYDIIFSDIRIDDGLSFDAFSIIAPNAPVIFTTAYNEYALQAFRNNGIDYLLKPISSDELMQAIDKARRIQIPHMSINELLNKLQEGRKQHFRKRFLLPKGDEYAIVESYDINHITTSGNSVRAFLNDGTSIMLSQTMNELEQQLDPNMFFRASRQYIVSINSIRKISNFFNSKLIIRLKGYPDVNIQVSKDKSSQLKEWLDH